MPAVTRQGVDPSAGHCFPPRPPDTGSGDVITNGQPTTRAPLAHGVSGPWGTAPAGDHYPTHCCGVPCHDGNAAAGSPTVIVNGSPTHRIGDAINCGDTSAAGSPDVFAGNQGFPMMVQAAPGVMLIGSLPVFDSSPEGQSASIASEAAFSSAISGSSVSGDAPPGAANEVNATYVDCGAFPAVITMEDMQKPVSKWFKLGNCRELPVNQRGLTAQQIACNWAALCVNILDPLYEQFKFKFNSGFRNASRDSGGDHGIGCAADISMSSTEQTIEMYKWLVHSGLPFSQIIYEKHNSAWVHVSFNGKGPKGSARTMWTYTGSAPYGHGGQNGESLPPNLA